MIQLKRIRKAAEITSTLRGNELGKKLKSLVENRIKFEKKQIDKFKVSSKWRPAKPLLLKESNNKCGFCESEVPSTYTGDVEHYRPKSIYWWMAYTIDNYILSCRVCNSNKSDLFETVKARKKSDPLPDLGDNIAIEKFVKKYALDPANENIETSEVGLKHLKNSERPKLINPYLDKPQLYFEWVFSEEKQEVEIIPKKGISAARKRDANYSIDLIKLNRSPLKRKRFAQAFILLEFKKIRCYDSSG